MAKSVTQRLDSGSLRAQPSHTTIVNKRLLMHARAAIKNAEEL